MVNDNTTMKPDIWKKKEEIMENIMQTNHATEFRVLFIYILMENEP